jgi:predicted nucleic acid-binding protein
MISNPSRLNSDHSVLVIDASVAINLLGTGRPADILRLLSRKVLIDELALEEVTTDPFSQLPGREAIDALILSGLISSVQLSALAFDMFVELTGASPPDDLGDGEAATIAQSFDIGAVPVIDERKATRISLSLRPKHPILHTIDILACSAITSALSPQDQGDLIYAALFHARMRVPVPCRDWVCSLIGPERAKSCPSLGSIKGFGLGLR